MPSWQPAAVRNRRARTSHRSTLRAKTRRSSYSTSRHGTYPHGNSSVEAGILTSCAQRVHQECGSRRRKQQEPGGRRTLELACVLLRLLERWNPACALIADFIESWLGAKDVYTYTTKALKFIRILVQHFIIVHYDFISARRTPGFLGTIQSRQYCRMEV